MTSKPHLVLVDQTIIIDRPIDQVFAFVANHENYALWFPDVISITSDPSEPHGTVGKRYTETIRLPTGWKKRISIPLVESNPPLQPATEGKFALLNPRMEYRLEAIGRDVTQLRWLFSSRTGSALGRALVRLLVGKALTDHAAVALPKLKAILESP